MDLTLRSAIMLSLLVHSVIFLPSIRLFCQDRHQFTSRDSITVDYIVEKEPTVEFKKNDTVRREVKETKKIPLAAKVDLQSKAAPAVSAPVKSLKDVADALAVRQAKVMSTQDYINYYSLIRENIRRHLKSRYRTYYNEGDACLIFILRSDGSLMSVGVDLGASTHDRTLLDTSIQSVKDAAPFTPFPKAIKLEQMSFTLTVSFRKD